MNPILKGATHPHARQKTPRLPLPLLHGQAQRPRVDQRLLAEGWIDPWLDEEESNLPFHFDGILFDQRVCADKDCILNKSLRNE